MLFSSFLILVLLLGLLLASCSSAQPPTPTSTGASSAASGQALMQERCSVCHSVSRVTSAHKTSGAWKVTVDRMINKGAKLTPQEEQTLLDYLAQTYQ